MTAHADRPNVLWIYGEDLGPQLGCYGERAIDTPHIDRLAAQGTRFSKAFVTCPVCSPSRSALITGRYQTSFGAHHHRSCRDTELPPEIDLITDCFRRAGYFTCNSPGPPKYASPGKTDFNFKRDQPFDGIDWAERAEGQPFYAQCNLPDTHRMQRFGRGGTWSTPPDPDSVDLPTCYPDHPIARRDWSLYLDTVRAIDEKVGMILDRLDDEGLTDKTIVFMMSDHGPGHPRHKQFCYDGGLHIPLIVRWPGHVEAGAVRDDLVSGVDFAPTTLSLAGVDIPSGMEGQVFLGPHTAPPREHAIAARDRCDEADERIRAVRTQRYKYIRNGMTDRPWTQLSFYKETFYPVLHLMRWLNDRGDLSPDVARFLSPDRPAEELYDLDADPDELHSLVGDASHEATLAELRATLDHWITTTGDLGQQPEDPVVVADWDRQMAETHARLTAEYGMPEGTDAIVRWWDRWIAERGGWKPVLE